MKRVLMIAVFALIAFALSGCNKEQIAKLETENADKAKKITELEKKVGDLQQTVKIAEANTADVEKKCNEKLAAIEEKKKEDEPKKEDKKHEKKHGKKKHH